MKKKVHEGVVVPMVTPFEPDGEFDAAAAGRIIEHIIEGGNRGIFVIGTTGEAPSLSAKIRAMLVETLCSRAGGRATTYAGISGNCLSESIEAAEIYFKAGIDAVVAHPPWYYPIEAEGIESYFRKLADALPGELLIYNMPKTTGISIPLETVERLSSHPNIAGMKDSQNDPERLEKTMKIFGGREDFRILMGAAVLSSTALKLGAAGIVPSSANLAPGDYQDLFEAATAGDFEKAERLQQRTNAISRMYQRDRSLGGSLAALKAAMSIAGLCGTTMLPPLVEVSAGGKEVIAAEMAELGLL